MPAADGCRDGSSVGARVVWGVALVVAVGCRLSLAAWHLPLAPHLPPMHLKLVT